MASLLASEVVLANVFAYRTSILEITFAFIPLMLVAILYGPKYSVMIGILSDLIGALLFPSGPFFIGYTISNGLKGLVYGLLLYQKNDFQVSKKYILKMLISIIICNILINCFLNTYWIYLTVNKAVNFFAPLRYIKNIIMIPISFFVMLVLSKNCQTLIREVKGVVKDND